MATEEWMTLEQAYNHVLDDVILPERAQWELLNKFQTGKVATRAARIVVCGPNEQTISVEGPLPSKTWRPSTKLSIRENAAERVDWGEGAGRPWFGANRAEEITVSARQLFQFWPKKAVPRSEKWTPDEHRMIDWFVKDIHRRGVRISKTERRKDAADALQLKIPDGRRFKRMWQVVCEKSGKKDELMKAGRKPEIES